MFNLRVLISETTKHDPWIHSDSSVFPPFMSNLVDIVGSSVYAPSWESLWTRITKFVTRRRSNGDRVAFSGCTNTPWEINRKHHVEPVAKEADTPVVSNFLLTWRVRYNCSSQRWAVPIAAAPNALFQIRRYRRVYSPLTLLDRHESSVDRTTRIVYLKVVIFNTSSGYKSKV